MVNITNSLIDWYSKNKRNLPWRDTTDPFTVWVSEIILQQTRVNQGLSYYNSFIKTFPSIQILAKSPIDKLLKVWQGLGYYSRARNMHHTAQDIVTNYNGEFPKSYHELLKLKGIGDYTASAIASISFSEPTPVLDGNVFRVISRVYGVTESTQTSKGKKYFKDILYKLIPAKDPGTFNQAIMEFGALQCTPKNPDCEQCILKKSCFAYHHNMIEELPLKKQKIQQKNRYFNYLHILYGDFTFVEQRTANDIWKLLYQFPLIETNQSVSVKELEKTEKWNQIFNGLNPQIDINYKDKTHILSHQKLHTRFYQIKIKKVNDYIKNNFQKVSSKELYNIGIPALLAKYLENFNK